MISYCCNQQVATIQNKQKGTKHMNPSDLTPEQQQSLGGMKTKTVYERTNYSTDITTGEILRTDTETIKKTTSEPEFIKLYYRTMLAFNGVDDIPLDFVVAISNFLPWSNDGSPLIFKNDKMTHDQIVKTCGIKDSMYQKYIARCKSKGLLFSTKYRGCYEVNPFFLAKGQWDSIRKLRANFDFVNGKWQRQMETEPTTPQSEESDTSKEQEAS